ncbi:MAG: O-antigen ligase family protein [Bacteroidetes bacterium]|nr:O-antigen ligase family protein [Bacteroidota bacterium]
MNKAANNILNSANYLLGVTALLLPLNAKICSYTIAAVLLLGIFYFVKYSPKLKLDFADKINLLPIILFVLMAISILYSHNKSEGLSYLSRQLSLLILPAIAFFLKDKINRKFIFSGSIVGCLVALCLCFMNALNAYNVDGSELHFYYIMYSYLLHPTYFSILLSCNIFFILIELKNVSDKLYRFVLHFINFIFLVNIITLNSRMATSVFIIALLIYFAMQWMRNENRKILAFNFIAYCLVIVSGIYWMLNHYNRITDMLDSNVVKQSEMPTLEQVQESKLLASNPSNLELRFSLWSSALNLIAKRPLLGYGIGDINSQLVTYYKEHKMLYAAFKELNPHNQYLQIFLATGIVGFAVFGAYVVLCFFIAMQQRDILGFLCLFILAANAMVESLMQHSVGIIFFMLVTILITHGNRNDRKLFSK